MPDQTESEKNELKMKTIADLNGLHFVIPSYQRGYRWREEQVQALIDDIQEFAKKTNREIDEFYCLQPIVVKPRKVEAQLDCSLNTTESEVEGGEIQVKDSKGKVLTYKYDSSSKKFTAVEYEVIDGQQRLTSIFLILKKLKESGALKEEISFDLKYDTRPETTDALNEPLKKASDNRIDEWHIKKAWAVIKESKSIPDKAWKDAFLRQTKVIWYEPEGLRNDNDSIEIFSRLNVGKIPLTNSELIRALFIIETKGKPPAELNEYKIASEWDFIEQQLHNDEFWCFCNLGDPFKKEYSNRIEFFFNLIEQRPENKTDQSHQTYSTFAMYSKKITEKEKVAELWQEIKKLYYRFHEWFIDDTLYHLIGFVRLNNLKPLSKLLSDADNKKQSKLQGEMLDLVKEKAKLKEMNDWCYGDNTNQIKNALLLFNLLSYEEEGFRFPWHRYLFKSDEKRRTWSLEHINAQNQKELEGAKWLEWAKTIEGKDIKDLLETVDENTPDSELPKERFGDLLKELQGSVKEYEHHISNIALLDRDDNSALGNCIFSEKREKIGEFVQSPDHFIPLATKNVFMKFYGNAETMQKWEKSDCETYYKSITELFNEKLPSVKLSIKLSEKGCDHE